MSYAVFKDNKQISKIYPTKEQAITHAFEKGLVINGHSDYEMRIQGFKHRLHDGIEIREVEDEHQ